MQRKYRLFLITAAVVFGLDRITKAVAEAALRPGEFKAVIPGFFNIVYVLNKGAAFGMLNRGDIQWQRWFFIIATLIAMVLILYFVKTTRPHERLALFGLGLIFGGAVGNLIDRIYVGEVFDFLDFYLGPYHWPAFNIADSGITVGAGLLVLYFLRSKPENNTTGGET